MKDQAVVAIEAVKAEAEGARRELELAAAAQLRSLRSGSCMHYNSR